MATPSVPRPANEDPLGCRAALAEALAAPALEAFDAPAASSPEAPAAAYQVAVALGRCRLFGVELGEADGVLPPGMALAAARYLSGLLPWLVEDARTLPERWDEQRTAAEAEELCLELLEARMETWAAYVALDEAFAESLDPGDQPPHSHTANALAHILDDVPRRFDDFDRALFEQIPLLATAANTELLNNWRALLAQPYREFLPWWLDGTLEQAAGQAYQQMIEELAAYPPAAPPVLEPPPAVSRTLLAFRKAFTPTAQLAAAVQEQPALQILRWDAPDSGYYAFLPLPTATQSEVVLSFFTSTHEPAIELANTEVRLDEVSSFIDAHGHARFSCEQLRAAEPHDATLRVGPEHTAWMLRTDEA